NKPSQDTVWWNSLIMSTQPPFSFQGRAKTIPTLPFPICSLFSLPGTVCGPWEWGEGGAGSKACDWGSCSSGMRAWEGMPGSK
uniref:Uncharacterized protein n=1 Tax=Varanus komodoensis TaxID=61221 RepID=A0A8D2JBW3_VARKO